jgi:GxxExxY protein
LEDEELTHSIIGAFYAVYNALGYGFVERVCAAALTHEPTKRGHGVRREVRIPIYCDGTVIADQRADMIMDDRIIIEPKVREHLAPQWERQLYNYLCAAPPYRPPVVFHVPAEAAADLSRVTPQIRFIRFIPIHLR